MTDAASARFEAATTQTPPVARRPRPFSLRLSDEERSELLARAGSLPLGTYIKSRLFDGRPVKRKAVRSLQDSTSLSRALALLGQSRIANNLNQLAKAANIGTLPVTTDVEDELREACAYVRDVRELLLSALGLKPDQQA